MGVARALDGTLETVRAIAADVLAGREEEIDREGIWPEENLRALLGAGLGGLVVPVEYDGLGYGLAALARVSELLGRVSPSTALCFGMHCVGSAVISAQATPYQQEHFLGPISRGEHLTTLSLSEAGTGSHFYLPQTSITPNQRDSYALNGSKTFVTNGGHADSYVLSAAAADSDVLGMFSCVIVPGGSAGMEWGPPWQGLGMRGNASRSLTLRDVHIPAANLLGEEGDQIWYVFNVIAPYFLMAMAGTYLGIAGAALEEASNHLRTRHYTHSGAALSQQSVLQHRLGTLWAMVERTRRLVYFAAEAGDAGEPDALPALMSAKAEVAQCAVQVVNEAMTLCGGIAYGDNSRLGRLLRDARAADVMAPTTDILRTWVGRFLLDLPILGD